MGKLFKYWFYWFLWFVWFSKYWFYWFLGGVLGFLTKMIVLVNKYASLIAKSNMEDNKLYNEKEDN